MYNFHLIEVVINTCISSSATLCLLVTSKQTRDAQGMLRIDKLTVTSANVYYGNVIC